MTLKAKEYACDFAWIITFAVAFCVLMYGGWKLSRWVNGYDETLKPRIEALEKRLDELENK